LNTLKKHTSAPHLSDKQTSRILKKFNRPPFPSCDSKNESHFQNKKIPPDGGYSIKRKASKKQRS
jgi:hypothetical protein